MSRASRLHGTFQDGCVGQEYCITTVSVRWQCGSVSPKPVNDKLTSLLTAQAQAQAKEQMHDACQKETRAYSTKHF